MITVLNTATHKIMHGDIDLVAAKEMDERNWRDLELLRTDELVKLPDYPDNLLPYRILLRDYPSTADFPSGTRPTI